MKRLRLFVSLPFCIFFLGIGCSGNADKNAISPTATDDFKRDIPPLPPEEVPVTPPENTQVPPPREATETETYLEEYARMIHQPKEIVIGAWNDFSSANHLQKLSDLDLSSEEGLWNFIKGFLAKTDEGLLATGTKLFGNGQMLFKFQGTYFRYSSGDDNSPKNPIFSEMEELRSVMGEFAQSLANDMNALFPDRFTFQTNSSECKNSPCKIFVEQSVVLLEKSVRDRNALREMDPITKISILDSFTAFFTDLFNDITFAQGDKYYTFYNIRTGESRLIALPQGYAFEGFYRGQAPANNWDGQAPGNNGDWHGAGHPIETHQGGVRTFGN